MKANKKTKHLEKEEDKIKSEEDGQEQPKPAQEPRESTGTGNKSSKEKQEDDIKGNGEIQTGEELEKIEKPKKGKMRKFLARLQKPWAWIAELKWRGTYILVEDRSCEQPGPSRVSMVDSKDNMPCEGEKNEDDEGKQNHRNTSEKMTEDCRSVKNFSSDALNKLEELSRSTSQSRICHGEKSNIPDISLEEPGTSVESSPGTAPLSLDSFTFHQTLGEGGFGQVYLAKDIIRKDPVAIKVEDKTRLGYGFVERHILQLSHENPYIIHGLAAFHTLNFVYYVMEVATGGDLLDVNIKNFPLDIATIKFITAEVVCGTEFLHTKGIIHRDLKQENILLTRDGHIKITDFGLAVTGVYKRTKEKCRGTPGYAAPEMVKGQAHGRGVDFFAIGVILYRLFAFAPPFPGKHPKEMDNSVLYHTPVYPEALIPDAVTQSIIEGLLCKDQLKRLGVKEEVRKHPFFSEIHWGDVEARRMAPPAILMAGSVDPYVEDTLYYAEPPKHVKSKYQKMFNLFSFVCPEWSKQYHPVITQTKDCMAKLFTMRSCRK